ncbi:DMT family transporter [Micromonospora sp. ATA32]|nr:DMT family transporter [Micromonospora sp. ATA32]
MGGTSRARPSASPPPPCWSPPQPWSFPPPRRSRPGCPEWKTTAALLVLGIVCTGATLALFYALITRVGPARAALAFYLSPAFAVAFGVAFLREQISVSAILGLGAIVVGSVLAAHRREPTPP